MKVLGIESTGSRLGVCLWEDFRVRAAKTLPAGDSHSEHLLPTLHDLFKKVPWTPQDLDVVAVDVGPGRFTGIRLGVSAAQAMEVAVLLSEAERSGAARQRFRVSDGPVFAVAKIALSEDPWKLPEKDGVTIAHRFRVALGIEQA